MLFGGCAYFEVPNSQYDTKNKPTDQIWRYHGPNNNLRLTLSMKQYGSLPIYINGKFRPWKKRPRVLRIGNEVLCTKAKTVFNRISTVSTLTDFSPHLIIDINEPRLSFAGRKSKLTVSADLYWGTGKFIKTYRYEDALQRGDISYTIMFESIAKQMLSDKLLVKYFNHGFNESLASSTPNIPQIPHLHKRYKLKIERKAIEARKRQQRKAEERKCRDVETQLKTEIKINQELNLKLNQAIQQERWEDAKNIQELIQLRGSPTVVPITKPAETVNKLPDPVTVYVAPKRSTSKECKVAEREYAMAVNTYNNAKSGRDNSNNESIMSGIAALNGGAGGLLMGILSDTSRKDSNTYQSDMEHALRVMQDAKRRVTYLCSDSI